MNFVGLVVKSLHSPRLPTQRAHQRRAPERPGERPVPSIIAAEGGYQEFILKGGEWAVLFLSALAALIAIAVGFSSRRTSWPRRGHARRCRRSPRRSKRAPLPTSAAVQDDRHDPRPGRGHRVLHVDGDRQAGRLGGADASAWPGCAARWRSSLGCVASGATGFIGMTLATRGNVRTAAAAQDRTACPRRSTVAFRTGGVAGMFTVGLGLLGATVIIMLVPEHVVGDPRRLRLRRLAARPVPARRRRHLHQGRRRRRRPRRQGRGGHPRGRPAQPGDHRRQRRRQRRRLRRHGRRPVRELRGHPRRLDHPRRRRVQLDRRQPGPRPDLPARRPCHRRGRLDHRRVRGEGQGGRDQRPQADQPRLPRRRHR